MTFLSGPDQRRGPKHKKTKQIDFQGELEDGCFSRFKGITQESCFATKKGRFTIWRRPQMGDTSNILLRTSEMSSLSYISIFLLLSFLQSKYIRRAMISSGTTMKRISSPFPGEKSGMK